MENNTQLKEMIRSMVIDILQGQKQEMASSQPIKQVPRGQVEPGGGFHIVASTLLETTE